MMVQLNKSSYIKKTLPLSLSLSLSLSPWSHIGFPSHGMSSRIGFSYRWMFIGAQLMDITFGTSLAALQEHPRLCLDIVARHYFFPSILLTKFRYTRSLYLVYIRDSSGSSIVALSTVLPSCFPAEITEAYALQQGGFFLPWKCRLTRPLEMQNSLNIEVFSY